MAILPWDVLMAEEIQAYLVRAFERQSDTSINDVRIAKSRITAEAARSGALQSGRTLLLIKEEYVKAVRAAIPKMARLAFDAADGSTSAVAATLEKGLTVFRDKLSDDLADFFRKNTWVGTTGMALGNDFLDATSRDIAGAVDDFRHGISEGARMTKDPVISVVNSVTNSPGAVVQAGIGNIQRVLANNGGAELKLALTKFVESKEVQSLPLDDQRAVADVVEVLTDETDKQTPDPSKVARWGKRLVELAEKFGISVAASGVSHLLFG